MVPQTGSSEEAIVMSLPSWLHRSGAGRTHGRRKQIGASSQRQRPARRLSVERLEDRLAPAAGSLDLSFSGDGKVTTAFTDPLGLPTQLHAEAVILQPDGM